MNDESRASATFPSRIWDLYNYDSECLLKSASESRASATFPSRIGDLYHYDSECLLKKASESRASATFPSRIWDLYHYDSERVIYHNRQIFRNIFMILIDGLSALVEKYENDNDAIKLCRGIAYKYMNIWYKCTFNWYYCYLIFNEPCIWIFYDFG